jgi:hypothetical protein
MYIISKFKDYYDGVVGSMGIDKTLVFERTTEIIEDKTKFPEPFTGKPRWEYRGNRNEFRNLSYSYPLTKESKFSESAPFIVGFCGKLYIGWKFFRETQNKRYPSLTEGFESIITYDLDFVKANHSIDSWGKNLLSDLDYILSYDPINLFRLLKTPIFIFDSDYERIALRHRRHEVFISNPQLKTYEFYKVMDSFTAFQEIQMFLGGVLGTGEKEIVEVEDKYKISQHGFDNKSFRRSKAHGKKRPQSKR